MRKRLALRGILCILAVALTACKSPPPAQPEFDPPSPPPQSGAKPFASLEFDHIAGGGIDQIEIHYRLNIGNPRDQPVNLNIKNRSCYVNGLLIAEKSAGLIMDGAPAGEIPLLIEPHAALEKKVILYLDLKDIAALIDDNDYRAELGLEFDDPLVGAVTAKAPFPRIREPQFTITAITIAQADLINTRFKITLRVDNPNVFPVTIASFVYELYGDNRFWGDGSAKNVLSIPAQSAAETDFEFQMNFINMRRQLLDDIIALRQVRYRFSGDASVETGIRWLPVFRHTFERSGNSEVKQK